MQHYPVFSPRAVVGAAETSSLLPTRRLTTSIRRLVIVSFALMALVATRAEAAACTWVAAGDPADSNFSGPLNWDDPPSPAADLFFAAGSAFAASFAITATADTTAPVISAVATGSIASTSAAITWTTDETATSQVEYGLTTAYGTTTTANPSLVLTHGVSVTGLLASTTYYFRVISRDAASNLATGADASFVVHSWDLAENQALFSMTGANASALMPSARHASSVTAFRPSTFFTGSLSGSR